MGCDVMRFRPTSASFAAVVVLADIIHDQHHRFKSRYEDNINMVTGPLVVARRPLVYHLKVDVKLLIVHAPGSFLDFYFR